jgi:hypothetical protein
MSLTLARVFAYGLPVGALIVGYFVTNASPAFAVGYYLGILFGAFGATALALHYLSPDKKESK